MLVNINRAKSSENERDMFPITSAIENKKGQCYKPRPRFYNSGNGSAKSQRDEGGSVAA